MGASADLGREPSGGRHTSHRRCGGSGDVRGELRGLERPGRPRPFRGEVPAVAVGAAAGSAGPDTKVSGVVSGVGEHPARVATATNETPRTTAADDFMIANRARLK